MLAGEVVEDAPSLKDTYGKGVDEVRKLLKGKSPRQGRRECRQIQEQEKKQQKALNR